MELIGGDEMSYKIAIASSDGIHIDETFGSAEEFYIFEVTDEHYGKAEIRSIRKESTEETAEGGCGNLNGCRQGGCHGGAGGGCSGKEGESDKVNQLADCRCVVCKKIGFHIQKQLERKAITAFDVTCTIEEALEKITTYFYKVDTHQTLRGNIESK